jgi:hypothetical protein
MIYTLMIRKQYLESTKRETMPLLYGLKTLNDYLDHKNSWCVAMSGLINSRSRLRMKAAITPSECVS